MRKFVLTAIILLTVTFGMLSQKANAQCQNGYTPRTISMVINNCPYEVYLCVYCGPGAYGGIAYLTGYKQTNTCVQTWTAQEVLDYIVGQMINPDFLSDNLCGPLNAPPCPDQTQQITTRVPFCWKVMKMQYLGGDIYWSVPCDTDNYCEETFTWCKDPLTGKYSQTIISKIKVGTINCTAEYPTIPNEYDVWSDCFVYHTKCNPQ